MFPLFQQRAISNAVLVPFTNPKTVAVLAENYGDFAKYTPKLMISAHNVKVRSIYLGNRNSELAVTLHWG